MNTNPKAGSFDVVLSDYDMPRVNGLELFRRLRAAGVGVPFVLASGWISEDLQQRAQALGIEQLLYQPLNIVELCALLNGLAHEARKGRSSARAVIDSASTPASLEPRV
jgi:CheY-like chemotaxis protein